MNSLREIL